jgi:hypothetical protein
MLGRQFPHPRPAAATRRRIAAFATLDLVAAVSDEHADHRPSIQPA